MSNRYIKTLSVDLKCFHASQSSKHCGSINKKEIVALAIIVSILSHLVIWQWRLMLEHNLPLRLPIPN